MMKIDYKQMEFLSPLLRGLLKSAEDIAYHQGSPRPTITSLYRIGDKGVHGTLPLRGADLRCRNKAAGERFVDKINQEWQYDPARPKMKCAILHGTGYNMHIHLQVHPNTIKLQDKNSL